MGQYYMPVIKRGKKLRRVYSHHFNNGLKLMEHSYINNDFVNVVANSIVENPAQLYWCGDYAEVNDFISESMFNRIYGYAWCRRRDCGTTLEAPNTCFNWSKDWYYINLTKRKYIKMPKYDWNCWTLNPISLLTAIGNGRGGGDYSGNNKMVGAWAGNKVYLSETKPDDKFKDVTAECDFGIEKW